MAKLSAAAERNAAAPLGPDAEMPAEYWESVLNDPQVAAKPGVPIQQRRLADLAVSTYVRFAPQAVVPEMQALADVITRPRQVPIQAR